MRDGHNKSTGANHNRAKAVTLLLPDGGEEYFGYLKGAAIKYDLNYGNLSHRGHSKGYQIK